MKLLPVSHFESQGRKNLQPIYGINTLADSVLKQTGEVIIAVPTSTGQGNPDILRVAQTWLPQELTRNVTRQRLLNCSQFRRAVSDGLIGLIDQETAEKMLRQSGAKEERERIDAQTRHIRATGAARTIADSKAEISRADGQDDEDEDDNSGKARVIDPMKQSVAQQALAGVEEHEKGISPNFKMWVDRISMGKDLPAKTEIKARARFSKAELSFMLRQLPLTFVNARAIINKSLNRQK